MVREVTLRRRRLLAAAGVSMAAIAGCTGSDDDPENDTEENSTEESFDDDDTGLDDDDAGLDDGDDDSGFDDGDDDGDDGDDDGDGYETQTYEGTDVRLVPMDEALEWHQDGSAEFIDARPAEADYDSAHVPGAVWNPNASGVGDESVYDWPEDETIVIYCSCPDGSTISGGRAASLIDDGYEDVFVMDETFDDWRDAGHPLEGADV